VTAATPKIRIRGLRKAFGEKVVLAGVDLDVEPGESLVIIGGSGTGKSVLLKCILSLVRPDAGSIQVDGEEIVGMSGRERERINRKFAMLFQGGALFDSLPVWENVAFGLIQGKGMARDEAKRIARAKLAAVGLGDDALNLYPSELSGGMQKRVSLARALATEPEILFFDEPTTGLDPIMSDVINNLIADITRGGDVTAVSITHDMASARKIADHIAMLHGGRIVWSGPAEVIDRSDNPYVDQFVHGRAEGPIRMGLR
jgi:phospholipid/cholesterol/gamma-HCH transport system ATP-binding protein